MNFSQSAPLPNAIDELVSIMTDPYSHFYFPDDNDSCPTTISVVRDTKSDASKPNGTDRA